MVEEIPVGALDRPRLRSLAKLGTSQAVGAGRVAFVGFGMKVTDWTRRALLLRRTRRDWEREGYEEVGEGGGMLWELNRGVRYRQVIKDVRIFPNGKSLFVKIGDP